MSKSRGVTKMLELIEDDGRAQGLRFKRVAWPFGFAKEAVDVDGLMYVLVVVVGSTIMVGAMGGWKKGGAWLSKKVMMDGPGKGMRFKRVDQPFNVTIGPVIDDVIDRECGLVVAAWFVGLYVGMSVGGVVLTKLQL